ncbi:MAG: FG-GAP-like repeat-containing protein, partial [Thermoanaerobaculia bacterium]|nr:FG-GAP-like repeat-containing protein [Thermoanaerobaculia bacterium]
MQPRGSHSHSYRKGGTMSLFRLSQSGFCNDIRSPFTVILLFCLGASFLGPPSAVGQLTVTDNLHLTQDDFDLNSAAQGNLFGWATVTCDFDGDGYVDLAIGAPGTSVFGVLEDAGAVYVAYGSPGGLTLIGHQTLTQPPAGSDPPEANDYFGAALAAGDFDGDGRCDLAVGAPREVVVGVSVAGSVHVFTGTASGLASASQVWTQNS